MAIILIDTMHYASNPNIRLSEKELKQSFGHYNQKQKQSYQQTSPSVHHTFINFHPS